MSSIVITVLNEEGSIQHLLQSIANQNLKPSETIIVDAGSKDATIPIIKKFSLKHPNLHIKLISSPDATRSQGRNTGIHQSRSKTIAITDAGCVLDPEWLEKITKPIHAKQADVVAGNYLLTKDPTPLQWIMFHLASPSLETRSRPGFLPSSRSLALTKTAWKKVNGYPENLNTAEDLVFAQNLAIHPSIRLTSAPDAIAYWSPASSFKSILRHFYNYAFGDGLAGEQSPHQIKYYIKSTVFLFFYFLLTTKLWTLTCIALFAYFLFKIIKLTRKNPQPIIIGYSLLLIPALFFITLTGFWMGKLASHRRKS